MFLLGLSPAQALPNQPNHIITEPIVTGPIVTGPIVTGQALALDNLSFSFIPPEDSGQPRTNRAGGRRDQLCNHSMPTPSLTLLMPPTNQGTTTAEHPTFLAYIPQTSAQQVFLTMEDEDNNYFYHTTFPLPDQAGIVSFTMPDMAPSLKPEKYYKVSLAMMCGAILDPNDPVVEGWIKRVELDLPLSPDQGQDTALERSALYANNGLWFDAITALADLLRSQPDNPDIIDAWEELLQSVELELLQIELL
ncbi:DUF928 domain-containing protein [Leptothoe sp. PORK10 BA2]|uniref:DUF928 domain-containing protein n=1 Tax=Leptothoe sp. PORK10 BA2 TaxID=3110254 RepID=UPI002B20E832|nr:DUF928 domain-containing protein [Leptothoe sp. PORK10 BA2]MEA5464366.1 DUF928 domain-containing protein [Leptothoe sp. PORK10 BA2]